MTDRPAGGWLRLLGWVLLALALGAQVYGLYAPTVPGPGGTPGLDKVGHLLAFGVPTFLAWLLGARWVVLLLLVHALAAEPLQHALAPNRVAEVGDAVANVVGVTVGVLAARPAARWRHDEGMPSVDERVRRG